MKFEIDYDRPFALKFKKDPAPVRLADSEDGTFVSIAEPFAGVMAMGFGFLVLMYLVVGVAGIVGLLGFIFGIVNFAKACPPGERFSHKTSNLVGFLLNLLVPVVGQYVGGSMCLHAARVGKCTA